MRKDIDELKLEKRQISDYNNTISSVRRDKGLPDPFYKILFGVPQVL
jgi:hypothetical protein